MALSLSTRPIEINGRDHEDALTIPCDSRNYYRIRRAGLSIVSGRYKDGRQLFNTIVESDKLDSFRMTVVVMLFAK